MARLCARCPCHVDAELCKAALGVMLQHLQRLKKEKKKKATNAQGTLLMTWMDTNQWLVNEHQPGHLYTCAHISTHLNWHMFICVADMARWCNPLLSPGFHIFSPPVLGLCCCPIGFRPTLQQWCEMNGRLVGGSGRHAVDPARWVARNTQVLHIAKTATASVCEGAYWPSLCR